MRPLKRPGQARVWSSLAVIARRHRPSSSPVIIADRHWRSSLAVVIACRYRWSLSLVRVL